MHRQSAIKSVLKRVSWDISQTDTTELQTFRTYLKAFKTHFLEQLPTWFLELIVNKRLSFLLSTGNPALEDPNTILVDPSHIGPSHIPQLIEITDYNPSTQGWSTQPYLPRSKIGFNILQNHMPFLTKHILIKDILMQLMIGDPAAIPLADALVKCANIRPATAIVSNSTARETILRLMQLSSTSPIPPPTTIENLGSECSLRLIESSASFDQHIATCAQPIPDITRIIPTSDPSHTYSMKQQASVLFDLLFDPDCSALKTSTQKAMKQAITRAARPPMPSPVQPRPQQETAKSIDMSPAQVVFFNFFIHFTIELLKKLPANTQPYFYYALKFLKITLTLLSLFTAGTPAILMTALVLIDCHLSDEKESATIKELKQFLIFAVFTLSKDLSDGNYTDFASFSTKLISTYSQIMSGKYLAKAAVITPSAYRYTKSLFTDKKTKKFKSRIKFPKRTHQAPPSKITAQTPTKQPAPTKVEVEASTPAKPAIESKKITAADIPPFHRKKRTKPKEKPAKHAPTPSAITRDEEEASASTSPLLTKQEPEIATFVRSTKKNIYFDGFNLSDYPEDRSIILHMNHANQYKKLVKLIKQLKENGIEGMITGGLALQIIELLFGLRTEEDFNPHHSDIDIITTPADLKGELYLTPEAKPGAFTIKQGSLAGHKVKRVDLNIDRLPPIEASRMLCPPATDTEFQHLTDEQKAKEMLIQLIYSRHLTSKSAAVDININPNGHITLYIPNKHALEHILNKELNFDLGLRGKQLQPEWILMMLAMQCEGYQPSSNAATKQLVKIAVGKTIYNLNGFTKLNLLRKYFMRHGSAYYQQLCNYTVDTLDGDMELILTLFPGCTHLTAANLAENMPAFLQQLDDIKKIAASKDESFQHTALFLVLCQSSIKQYIHDNIAFHRHTTLTDYKKELLEFIKSHGLQHFASLGIDFTRQYGVEALLEQYKMVASDIASIFTSHLFNDTPHSKHFKPLVDYLNKATTPSINLPCQRLSDLIKQRIEINAKLRQQQMDYQATQGARVSPVALVNRPH